MKENAYPKFQIGVSTTKTEYLGSILIVLILLFLYWCL